MNILLFLTPKKEVSYLELGFTGRQALEKMENHRYSSTPIINDEGEEVGTLSEGDLLYFIKNHSNLTLEAAEDIPLSAVTRHVDYLPVSANAELKDIFERAMDQNFVPVIDDGNHFIGIITRKKILNHFKDKIL